jgi:hypothetical protein
MYVSASGDRQRAKVKILNSKGIANQTGRESSVAYDSPVQDISDTFDVPPPGIGKSLISREL